MNENGNNAYFLLTGRLLWLKCGLPMVVLCNLVGHPYPVVNGQHIVSIHLHFPAILATKIAKTWNPRISSSNTRTHVHAIKLNRVTRQTHAHSPTLAHVTTRPTITSNTFTHAYENESVLFQTHTHPHRQEHPITNTSTGSSHMVCVVVVVLVVKLVLLISAHHRLACLLFRSFLHPLTSPFLASSPRWSMHTPVSNWLFVYS